MKYATQKIKKESGECSMCAAKFEIWLSNSRVSDEKKEKMSEHLLSYCPVCSRVGDR